MPGQTILVADDDPVALQIIAASLRQQGYQVLMAVDAMQAFAHAQRGRPAAIVLDIMMPAGSGLDVLRKLKMSTRTMLVPVIAMSSSVDTGLPEQARQLGAAEFMPKPLDLDHLGQALKQLLAPPATTP
jgi:CheY-like chemotaxis protein